MDTQLIPYRLRSARQKKRALKTHRDKQLLALDRERQRISSDPAYKTTIPLDEPYQKGWKRLYVLKPEVQLSDKAEFYQAILNTINEVQYHYHQSFKPPKRKGIWHKYIFKELPKLHGISPYNWHENRNKLSEQQRACFIKVEYWNQHYYRWEHYYEFTETGLFELAVVPHIIDSIKVGDALLEQRLAWIDDHMERNALYNRLYKLKDGSRNHGRRFGAHDLKYSNPLKHTGKIGLWW